MYSYVYQRNRLSREILKGSTVHVPMYLASYWTSSKRQQQIENIFTYERYYGRDSFNFCANKKDYVFMLSAQ